MEGLESKNYSIESCQSWVSVSLDWEDGESDFKRLLGMSYTEILKLGFLLNWPGNNCSNCETSGGRCGFENNDFICFCRDRPHSKTCDDGISFTNLL